jgi:RHS repeat-associated protein
MFNDVYPYKDHLGNVRLSYGDSDSNGSIDANTEIISEKNYYPFGLTHSGYNNVISGNSNAAAEKLGFGGKELQKELGLDWYDVSARNYDPALGRWMNVDPLAEQMPSWSLYNYVFNNPINLVDPTGMAPEVSEWKPDKNGNLVAEAGDNAKTLAKHLSVSQSEASKMIKDQGLLTNILFTDDTVYENQTLEVDNNITRGINNSKGITIAEAKAGKKGVSSTDAYYCDQGAQMAVNGDEINSKNATNYSQFFPPHMKDFKQVDSFDSVPFNKGIALIGTGLEQHVVSNYGQSSDGTNYVFSKDGNKYKPQVYTLQHTIDLVNKSQYTNFTLKDVRFYQKK